MKKPSPRHHAADQDAPRQLGLGREYLFSGDLAAARSALNQALQLAPLDPQVFLALADLHQALGDQLASLAHRVAAETLAAAGTAMPIYNVATGYLMKGEPVTAEYWYQLALMLDPTLAGAHQNLAVIYSEQGRAAEAEVHRRRAYRLQRVFIDGAAGGLRVLVPFIGGGLGNVPFETLLPMAQTLRIKYAIDFAGEAEDQQLPAFDVVFNAVGDPDSAAPLHSRLLHFADHCAQTILNHPAAVARTQRHRVAELFNDFPDIVVPECRWLGGESASADTAMPFPLLLRPAGTHGGEGLQRCDTQQELKAARAHHPGGYYLTRFHDFRSADGYYRKYRVIFIDRQPFAYHLAISSRWVVHYFSAEMAENPWKLAEERCFLQAPEQVLGAPAMAVLHAMGQRLGLDYGGIDFARLDDGRLLLFEANATMLIHYERENGPLAYKNAYIKGMVDAFRAMLERAFFGRGPSNLETARCGPFKCGF